MYKRIEINWECSAECRIFEITTRKKTTTLEMIANGVDLFVIQYDDRLATVYGPEKMAY